jgi:hypothetical protein
MNELKIISEIRQGRAERKKKLENFIAAQGNRLLRRISYY